MDELAVHLHPVLPGAAVHNLHSNLLELLLVLALSHLGLNLPSVDVLLQHQQDLVGVDGFDEIVGNLLADGLLHNILFLALSDHHNRCRGRNLLDALKGLKPGEAWHLLVEHHQVKRPFTAQVYGIGAVAARCHFIAFLFEEDDVCL